MRVELRKVSRRFGSVHALRDMDLKLPTGSRVAVIGPNGSGKSTLIRVIMGMTRCRGDVALDGLSPFQDRDKLARSIAYVPQVSPQIQATVGEVVRAITRLRNQSVERVHGIAADLMLDLDEIHRRPFCKLSGGMRQKLLVAVALAADATLLVLDEPTASLDPASRQRFYELVEALPRSPTVLLSSHRLEEIQRLVSRVVVLQDGALRWNGPVADYLVAHSGDDIHLPDRASFEDCGLQSVRIKDPVCEP